MTGIVGFGIYVPRYRLKITDIAQVWEKDPGEMTNGFRVAEKAVPAYDEDAVTIGIEAATLALQMAGISAEKLGSLYVGSESHPYVVNPSATIIAEYLGVGNNYLAADLEFACKAATAGLQITHALVASGQVAYGMVIGADTAQGKPQDALEYTAASAGAAYIVGKNPKEIIARILETSSFSSDTSDFWRREGARYPTHFGRFTGEPAYFTHVVSEAKKLLLQSKLEPKDFAYCVFHMPNGKFPRIAAKKLGFTAEQLAPSLIVESIGNPYSASALTGLAAVLDIAKPGEKIFFVSYGSGAGSDGFIFETTKYVHRKQQKTTSVTKRIEQKRYISYAQYLKQTHII